MPKLWFRVEVKMIVVILFIFTFIKYAFQPSHKKSYKNSVLWPVFLMLESSLKIFVAMLLLGAVPPGSEDLFPDGSKTITPTIIQPEPVI